MGNNYYQFLYNETCIHTNFLTHLHMQLCTHALTHSFSLLLSFSLSHYQSDIYPRPHPYPHTPLTRHKMYIYLCTVLFEYILCVLLVSIISFYYCSYIDIEVSALT